MVYINTSRNINVTYYIINCYFLLYYILCHMDSSCLIVITTNNWWQILFTAEKNWHSSYQKRQIYHSPITGLCYVVYTLGDLSKSEKSLTSTTIWENNKQTLLRSQALMTLLYLLLSYSWPNSILSLTLAVNIQGACEA